MWRIRFFKDSFETQNTSILKKKHILFQGQKPCKLV